MLLKIGLVVVCEGQREFLEQLNDLAGSRTVPCRLTLLQDSKVLQQSCLRFKSLLMLFSHLTLHNLLVDIK